ncbi:MAG: hypothetical protein IPN01_17465 [Deltaproteobacteria bacterium]|nr:hypothetical protein [Deltaproteobacteria bacterium]
MTELRRSAIDLRGGWLHLDGKTGPRMFPLSPELWSLLSAYADGTDAWLFTGPRRATAGRIYKHLVASCARLGRPVFTPHGLRRMIGRPLRSGVDIKTGAEEGARRRPALRARCTAPGTSGASAGCTVGRGGQLKQVVVRRQHVPGFVRA